MITYTRASWTKADLDAMSVHVYPYLDDLRQENYLTWVGLLPTTSVKIDLVSSSGQVLGAWYSLSLEEGHRADVHLLPKHWAFYNVDHSRLRDAFMQHHKLKLLYATIPILPETLLARKLAKKMGFKITGLLPAYAKHNKEFVDYAYYAYVHDGRPEVAANSVEGQAVATQHPQT